MRKLLSTVLLILVLTASFCCIPVTGVSADSIAPLSVYLQKGTGTPELVHTYSQAEMEGMATGPRYYSGIDNLPADVQGKGIGVLLTTLIANLQTHNPAVSFGPGVSMKISSSSDGYFKYITYEYLFGTPRYCFPNLNIDPESNNKDMSDAVPADPMFCVTSAQHRFWSRAELDSQPMDSSYSYRFCFGLSLPEVQNTNPPDMHIATADKFGYRLDRIDIIIPAHSITVGGMTGGTVMADKTSAVAGETVMLTVIPDSGKKLTAGSLAAGNSGISIGLSQISESTFTFTMPSGNVNVIATFEDIPPCTVTFVSEGETYTTQSSPAGSSIDAPEAPVKSGHTFEGWYTDEDLTNEVSFPYTLTDMVTMYAKWEEIRIYTVSVAPAAGDGDVSVEQETVLSGDSSVVNLCPAEGYYIAAVTDNGEDVLDLIGQNTYTVSNVTSNHNVIVSFALNTYAVTPSAGDGGSISPGVPQTVNHGDTPEFIISPDTGYRVDTVEVDDTQVTLSESNRYVFPAVSADHTISATFVKDDSADGAVSEPGSARTSADPNGTPSESAGSPASGGSPEKNPASVNWWVLGTIAGSVLILGILVIRAVRQKRT